VATLYTYDELGRISLVEETGILAGTFQPASLAFSNSTSRVTKTEYDALGRPERTILNYHPESNGGLFNPGVPDINVHLLTYYDAAGRVTWTRDGMARWNKTVYDDHGRVFMTYRNYENGNPSTVDAANTAWTTGTDNDIISAHGYNTLGQLQYTIENYVDGAPAASQNANGSWTITEVETDRVTLFSYDTLGRKTDITPNYLAKPTVTNGNYTRTTRFDPATGRVQNTNDLLGQWHAQVYDELGRLTHTIQNCRSGVTPTLGGFAACGAQITDRNVRTTKSTYDAFGRVFETTDVLGFVTRTTFDPLDRPIEVIANYQLNVIPTAEINVKTTTTYLDNGGRSWRVTDPTGRNTTYQTDAFGQVTSTTDAATLVTRTVADRTGVRWSKAPTGAITVIVVDGLARPVITIENFQNGTVEAGDGTTYDLTTTTYYDLGGRVNDITTPAGEVTRRVYDLRDQLVTVIEGVKATCPTYTLANADCNLTTDYTYNRAGNLTAIKNPLSYTRTMGYGTRDELLWTKNELNTITDNRQYDRAGQLIRTDVNGSQLVNTYSYDELGRQKTRNGQSWTYDALGRTMSFTDPAAASTTYGKTGILNYSYDTMHRVKQTQGSLDGDLTTGVTDYAYDAAGRVTRAGPTTFYEYDSAGRPSFTRLNSWPITEQTYDSVGRPNVLKRYYNGSLSATTTTTYDTAHRMATLKTVTQSTGATQANFIYTYDRASRVKTQSKQTINSSGNPTTANFTYSYDLVGRLMTEVRDSTTTDYRYDAVGNRTLVRVNGTVTQSRGYNAANQVTNPGWTYEFGRLKTDGTTTYSYDAMDRLTSYVQGGVTFAMSYHGESMVAQYRNGVRQLGLVHNTVTGANSTLLRLHDARNPSIVVNTSYMYNVNGQPVWSSETIGSTSTQRIPLTDHIGTVFQEYQPAANGSIPKASNTWGEPINGVGAELRFAGEFQDGQSGLVFLRARWYQPSSGTFLTRDPFAGFPTTPYSQHQYQYGHSNPVSNTDPSGLYCMGSSCRPYDADTVEWINFVQTREIVPAELEGIDQFSMDDVYLAEASFYLYLARPYDYPEDTDVRYWAGTWSQNFLHQPLPSPHPSDVQYVQDMYEGDWKDYLCYVYDQGMAVGMWEQPITGFSVGPGESIANISGAVRGGGSHSGRSHAANGGGGGSGSGGSSGGGSRSGGAYTPRVRPHFADTPGGFVNWMKDLETEFVTTGFVPSTQQLDGIVSEAVSHGVYIRLDPPHSSPTSSARGTVWATTPHLNVGGKKGDYHVPVPQGYVWPLP
jgi:RHS repeat-associated protein